MNEEAKKGPERVFRILSAAVTVPGVSNEPIEIDGQKWADGAYGKGNKFKEMNESCTHRLSLKNFPKGKGSPSLVNKVVGLIAKRRYGYNAEVSHQIRSQHVLKEYDEALLEQKITDGEMTAVVQIPPGGKSVSSLSIDSEEIEKMYKAAGKYMEGMLDPNKPFGRSADAPKPAGEELKAMEASGKPAETQKAGAESPSVKADKGTAYDREANDPKEEAYKGISAEAFLRKHFHDFTTDKLIEGMREVNPGYDREYYEETLMSLIKERNKIVSENRKILERTELAPENWSPLTLRQEIKRNIFALKTIIKHPGILTSQGPDDHRPEFIPESFALIEDYKRRLKANKGKIAQGVAPKVEEKKAA